MAGGNLSPRQKMINMMYLVLTALLALNVSKEVLNSFFEVNKGIERTTNNFNSKNESTYAAFDNAASNNPEKYQEVRDKAYLIKNKADEAVLFIQEMKYDLVCKVDKNKIYFGSEADIYDADGDLIESLAIVDKNFTDLTQFQKSMPIAYLKNKSNRYASQDLFYPKSVNPGVKKRATQLKEKIEEYRDFLINLSGNNQGLIDNINIVFDVSDRVGKKQQNWETYNFVDMPSVSALTILSKIQSDLRNLEADVIDYLKRDIDSKSLKFTSAEGIQIPKSNFVLRGDSFRSSIFISAKQDGQDPEIFVGEYDSLGGGKYEMRGEYEVVRVINGKGVFSKRTNSEGLKKYGGLISMKTETGTKFYPFNGEYLVAAKTAVVSPVKMNILYTQLDNPIKVSVPGYTSSEISAVVNNGKIKPTKKSLGEWSVRPVKEGKAKITLFANVDGKRTKMGEIPFRVKVPPPPTPYINGVKNGLVDRTTLTSSGGVLAELKNFEFEGLTYLVTEFKLSGTYKGAAASDKSTNNEWTKKMKNIIVNSSSGSTINISKIKAIRYGTKIEQDLNDLVIEIK
jgi:gliding motility-associated protein GldM